MVINMSEYNNVPKIRFKGFTDVWEQRKLEEISNRFDNLRVPVSANEREKGTTPYYGANGIQDYVKGFTHNGEYVLIAEDGANDLKNYPVKYVNGLFWANNHVHVVQGKEGICDNKYLKYCFTKTNIESLLVGGGRAKLNANIMMSIDLTVPSFNEQVELGRMFYELDNLITLHQRKCDTLVNVKKSLLEKMFPKNSSNIPEIRFKGFTDVWEQRKFENIFNYERPDKYIVNSTEYLEFGPTPVLTANKAFILGYTTEKNKYVNSHESIIFDDFTLDTKFVDFPYMVKSSAIKILTLKDEKKDNIRFNFELLSNHRFNMLGHARHYISVVQPEEVFTTNKQEQNKIGDLFTNIDNLITLHQRKLEKLNNIKKSMLDKMFV